MKKGRGGKTSCKKFFPRKSFPLLLPCALHHIQLAGHVLEGTSLGGDAGIALMIGAGNEESGSLGGEVEVGAGVSRFLL